MSTSHDKWHTAAYSASFLARHAAVACGAHSYGKSSPFHEDCAEEELRKIATVLGFDLVKRAPSSTVTILPLDPEEEAA